MQDFAHMLNEMLVEVYHNILRVEEDALKTSNRISLSIREMHLIECVGMDRQQGKTVSEIADYLKVTRASATVAVAKLEKKGYLEKKDWDKDGRVVRVFLTREGRKIYAYHRQYHMNMVRAIEQEFAPEEREVLMRTIAKLNRFFNAKAGGDT